MVRRFPILVAMAVSLVGCGSAQARTAALPQPEVTHPVVFRQQLVSSAGLGCDRDVARGTPRMVIAGASFTAGVGSGPSRSWAVLLARRLHWAAMVYGDPGAGYVRAGAGRKGPVAAEIGRLDLRALKPSLVIVQAGHDDIGVPPGLERTQVARVIALIRAE